MPTSRRARCIGAEPGSTSLYRNVLRPFVYRRYLDFGVFESLREMKELIAREVERRELQRQRQARPRRHPRDRVHRAGLPADARRQRRRGCRRAACSRRCRCSRARSCCRRRPSPSCARLYRFLRRVENRLQEWNDEQTHELPRDDIGRARLALAMGAPDWADARGASIARHRDRVSAHFRRAGVRARREPERRRDASAQDLDTILEPGSDARRELAGVAGGRTPRSRSRPRAARAAARERLLPAARRDAAVAGCRRCCRACCGRSRAARPRRRAGARAARDRAHRRAHGLPRAAQRERRRARAAGRALRAFAVPRPTRSRRFRCCSTNCSTSDCSSRTPTRAELAARAARAHGRRRRGRSRAAGRPAAAVPARGDVPRGGAGPDGPAAADEGERPADRHRRADRRARRSTCPGTRSSRGTACRAAAPTEPRCAGRGMIVVAYGKFGGIELGYGSDLDLVFLHDSAGEVQRTAGPAVVDNGVFFLRARAAPRAPADGALGGRPPVRGRHATAAERQGRAAGAEHRWLRATTSAREAWTWEHQALLRARAVAGPPGAARTVRVAAPSTLLRTACAATTLREDVRGMRERMRAELVEVASPAQFDLKQDAGGITDIEFLAQYWTLRWCRALPGAGDLSPTTSGSSRAWRRSTSCRRRPSTC